MLSFELKNAASHARIWYEPKEEFFFDQYSKTEVSNFECNQCQVFNDKIIIIEINIFAGSRYIYGLLGAKYHFINNNKLEAKINLTRKLDKVNNTLLQLDTTYLGLSEEFSTAIHQGLNRAYKENKLLLNGTIDFCYAVNDLAYSNIWIFRILSYLLMDLFLLEEKKLDRNIFLEKLKVAYVDNF